MKKNIDNKRNYYRIYFDTPLCSTMTIALVNNTPVNISKSNVCIQDISAGGLRFICNFEMPISSCIIIDFNTKILGQALQFSGYILRRERLKTNTWEYGVTFIATEKTSFKYLDTLNKLEVKLSKNYRVDCNFCSKEDKTKCFFFTNK